MPQSGRRPQHQKQTTELKSRGQGCPLDLQKRTNGQALRFVRLVLPAQPVDATQALNFSAGVSNPRVLRGRSLSWRATLLRWACEYTDKSAPFGKYCLSRPLVFSLEPRCH